MTKNTQASTVSNEGTNVPSKEAVELELLKKQYDVLAKQIESLSTENKTADALSALAQALTEQNKERTLNPSSIDNINRTNDFKNSALFQVDSTSLEESQQTLMSFRGEDKKPISIPKALQTTFGPSLVVTVNGVRVSIPCDGRTHFINETHWEHAKERIAKVDFINSKDTENVITV